VQSDAGGAAQQQQQQQQQWRWLSTAVNGDGSTSSKGPFSSLTQP